MQLRYLIHLYFDDGRYVAVVPGRPDLRADGASYAEALGRLEPMLQRSAGSESEAGPDAADPACFHAGGETGSRCRSSAIKARLVMKFGRMSNRQLAARIGVVAPDAPVMLSSALGGRGSRQVRCAIALVLDELPSLLWPDGASRVRAMDDSYFLNARLEMRKTSAHAVEQAAHGVYAG